MHRISVPAGAHIYERGQPAETAYLVLAGRVLMRRPHVDVEVEVGKGSIIGFSALNRHPYRSNAIAVEDCELLAFSRRELRAMIRSNPDQALEIIEGIIRLFGSVVAEMERALATLRGGPADQA